MSCLDISLAYVYSFLISEENDSSCSLLLLMLKSPALSYEKAEMRPCKLSDITDLTDCLFCALALARLSIRVEMKYRSSWVSW